MRPKEALAALLGLWRRYALVVRARGVLEWDQETKMPPAGIGARAGSLEALSGLAHEILTAPAVAEALAALEPAAGLDPLEQAQVREARRAWRLASRVPRALVEALARATAEGLETWREARRRSDFALFAPTLARIVGLKRDEAACLREEGQAEDYDALLDQYEPGLTAGAVAALFADLTPALRGFLDRVLGSGRAPDESAFRGELPGPEQEAFGREVLAAMGFPAGAGRIDPATHPFCAGLGPGDVRITWRHAPDDLRPALFGLVHEAGHALYEAGLDPHLDLTPAGGAVSLGVHESQSRLWENLVARSLPFWEAFAPRLPARLGGPKDPAACFRAANVVRPGPIRVEADEVTYNLHVQLRFALERDLIAGRIEVADLPARWDGGVELFLGLKPRTAAEGVLQDIHWAMGGIGYFPTYTLGNIYAAHLFAAARRELAGLEERIRQADFAPLREWLRAKVHRHGSVLPAERLVAEAAGSPPTAAALLEHLDRRVAEVYGA